MKSCRVCLRPLKGDLAYHASCLKKLFGTSKPPTIEIELAKFHTAALAMVGHTSLSGIQKKISVNLSVDRKTLKVAAEGGHYILKPQTNTYPNLPENEHVTTRLAELSGIEVATGGLISLADSSLAYIVRRFDRLSSGKKVRQEDFCQLAELSPKEKYDGSAELCVRLVRKYCTEVLIETRKLFQRLLFTWWSGNGDMHLKNFSVLTDEQRIVRLTPAYDLLCTHLVIENDPLALPLGGKQTNLRRNDWLEFAEYCRLPAATATRLLEKQASATEAAVTILGRSDLPEDQQIVFQELLRERTRILRGG